MRRLLPALAIGLMVAGCAGQMAAPSQQAATATDQPTPSPTDSPTPSPSPSPTVDPAAAAAGYLALAAAFNKTACEQVSALTSGDPGRILPAEAAVADAYRLFSDNLRSLQLPAKLEAAKTELLRDSAASENLHRQLSVAATAEAYNASLPSSDAADAAGAALSNFIRGELGLKSTPGSSCA